MVSVRIKSSLYFRGELREVSTVLDVGVLDAVDLLATHRCELVHAADQAKVEKARDAETKRLMLSMPRASWTR